MDGLQNDDPTNHKIYDMGSSPHTHLVKC